MAEYDGGIQYCPVRGGKCQEVKELNENMKTRIPIWVGKLFFAALILVLSYMNLEAYRSNEKMIILLNEHLKDSTVVLKHLTHEISETGVNQRRILEKIGLEYQDFPER